MRHRNKHTNAKSYMSLLKEKHGNTHTNANSYMSLFKERLS